MIARSAFSRVDLVPDKKNILARGAHRAIKGVGAQREA
jgi:hypothetical protein